MKLALRLFFILSLIVQQVPARAELAGLGPDIQNFVKKHKNNWAAYHLSEEEMREALSDYGLHALYLKQVEKTIRLAEGAQDPEEKITALKAEAALNDEAYQLVDRLFKQKSIEQMNLDLLMILHTYVVDEDARGPLNILLNQIEQYHFSAEQLQALRKEQTLLHQYSEGALASFGALFLGSIACLKLNCQPLVKAVDSVIFGRGKKIVTRVAEKQSEQVPVENMTWNDLINDIEKLGVRSAPDSAAAARATTQTRSQLTQRKRLITKLMSLRGDLNFRNFALVTGATVVGGSVNIGWNALNRAFYEVDITNTYLNPGEYKSDLFDAMAVARLSCRSYDLAQKTAGASALDQKDPKKLAFARELNALYTEYAILQRIALRYQEKVLLPASFAADTERGLITLSFSANGKAWSESVSCAKVRGAGRVDRLEVNLGEVLHDLNSAYENMLVKKSEE